MSELMKSKGPSLLVAFTHPAEKPRGDSSPWHQPPAPRPGARLGRVSEHTSRARARHERAHSTQARVRPSLRTCARLSVRLCALCSRRSAAATQPLGRGAHDGSLFAAAQVELPGEEDEVGIPCAPVSTQLQGQRGLDEGRVDALAPGTGTWGPSPKVRRS